MDELSQRSYVTKLSEFLRLEPDLEGSPIKLSVRKLRALLNCCLDNAKQLTDSAEILFEKKMYSVSVTLSILAMEELGKRVILKSYIWAEDNDKERSKLWGNFLSHRKKLCEALRQFWPLDENTKNSSKNGYISLMLEQDEQLKLGTKLIDQMKQLTTYVNIIDGEIVNPRRYAEKSKTATTLKLSKWLCRYHNDIETTDKIIQHYKDIKRERYKGESFVDFIVRSSHFKNHTVNEGKNFRS